MIFKHAISTVVSNRSVLHTEHRPAADPYGTWPVRGDPHRRRTSAEQRQAGAVRLEVEGGTGAGIQRQILAVGGSERAILVGVDLTTSGAQEPGRLEGARGRLASAC